MLQYDKIGLTFINLQSVIRKPLIYSPLLHKTWIRLLNNDSDVLVIYFNACKFYSSLLICQLQKTDYTLKRFTR